jgi:hypothetical protein
MSALPPEADVVVSAFTVTGVARSSVIGALVEELNPIKGSYLFRTPAETPGQRTAEDVFVMVTVAR